MWDQVEYVCAYTGRSLEARNLPQVPWFPR